MKLLIIGFLVGHCALTAVAQTPATLPQRTQSSLSAEKYFTDVELVNQYGEKMRLYTDILKGRTVVLDVFFTTCTSICPPMTQNMAKIQDKLANRLGKEVYLVSLTVDPMMDTPERLKDFAAKFQARRGWYFLTGSKTNVDFALNKLGQAVKDKNDHTSVWILGNESTGLWKKLFGMAKVDDLMLAIEEVVKDKAPTQ
jgi:protein SCO1/2